MCDGYKYQISVTSKDKMLVVRAENSEEFKARCADMDAMFPGILYGTIKNEAPVAHNTPAPAPIPAPTPAPTPAPAQQSGVCGLCGGPVKATAGVAPKTGKAWTGEKCLNKSCNATHFHNQNKTTGAMFWTNWEAPKAAA